MASDYRVVPTFCTPEWFSEKITANNNDLQRDPIIGDVIPISGGFCSDVTKVKLSWPGADGSVTPPSSVILKVISLRKVISTMSKLSNKEKSGPEIEGLRIAITTIHNNECFAYGEFMPHGLPNVPIPKCFFSQKLEDDVEGVILMEDLSSISGNVPISTGFSQLQIEQLISAVVAIQANGLNESKSWKSKVTPMKLENLAVMARTMETTFGSVRERNPKEYDCIDLETIKKLSDAEVWLSTLYGDQGDFDHPVFVHGDLWANNILVRKKDGKFTDEIVGIVDWQICHVGQPGEDLARIISFHLSPEDRRHKEWHLINQYYQYLTAELGQSPPFSLEYVREWYKRSIRVQGAYFLLLHNVLKDKMNDQESKIVANRIAQLINDIDSRY